MRSALVLPLLLFLSCSRYVIVTEQRGVSTAVTEDKKNIISIDTACIDGKPYVPGEGGCMKILTYKKRY